MRFLGFLSKVYDTLEIGLAPSEDSKSSLYSVPPPEEISMRMFYIKRPWFECVSGMSCGYWVWTVNESEQDITALPASDFTKCYPDV